MRFVLVVISTFLLVPVYSQYLKPGGVQGAIVWKITEPISSSEAHWKSIIADTTSSMIVRGKRTVINNYPAISFKNKISSNDISLNIGNLNTFSFFTVCQETDSVNEQVIFSLENDSLTQTLLSNFRMVALDQYKYYSYPSDRKFYPKIYSYSQNQSEISPSHAGKLLFGQAPRREDLPVSAYKGIVPEIIVFNRYVSPKERRQVESYLALKYGISLRQDFPAPYLNSSGEIIWDAELNAYYNNNIAGVGRDDLTGLLQNESGSTGSPGLLHISTPETFENNSFLIWGDNKGSLRFEDLPGVRKFQRLWSVSGYNSNDKKFNFRFDELIFNEIDPLNEGEIYWLLIDKSGSGKFPFGRNEYIRSLGTPLKRKLIEFSPVIIDSDSSGNDVFTLLIAPSFFTRSFILPPNCSKMNSGMIQTEIIGGTGPYNMTLISKSANENPITVSESDEGHIFKNIRQGGYSLYVSDAMNNTFSEEIWVSNTHTWESSLKSYYRLAPDENLYLNASTGMPVGNFQYTWTTPEGLSINSDELLVPRPGKYELSVTDEYGCNSLREISVLQEDKSVFRNIALFPNPVKGWFVLQIELATEANVKISVYDINGRLITSENRLNERYLRYANNIQLSGIYLIKLECGNDKESLKLIVQ